LLPQEFGEFALVSFLLFFPCLLAVLLRKDKECVRGTLWG